MVQNIYKKKRTMFQLFDKVQTTSYEELTLSTKHLFTSLFSQMLGILVLGNC
jgi:hypothetical protein